MLLRKVDVARKKREKKEAKLKCAGSPLRIRRDSFTTRHDAFFRVKNPINKPFLD